MSRAARFAVRVERTGTPLASDVHVASSVWARFRGLMWRGSLGPGEGLWLPGDASIHMLFMRFAIDAVFLAPLASAAGHGNEGHGNEGRARVAQGYGVVAVRRLRPWTGVVWYVRGARGCLELAAGTAEAAGLVPGDEVTFEPLA